MRDRVLVEQIKRVLDARGPLALVEVLALAEGAQRQARGIIVRCPVHADRSPSCSVYLAPDGAIGWRCHACGAHGDALALVATARRLDVRADFPRVLAEAAQIAGVALDGDTPRTAPPPRFAPPPAPERTPPPPGEVAALWAACAPVHTDAEVSAYLNGRAIDPALVADCDLARVLSPGATLPRWARYRGAAEVARPWTSTGYRLILPMLDAAGRMVTLRAWRCTDGDTPKRLPPAGHSIPRSVMANPLGRMLLVDGRAPSWWAPRVVIIVEGESDFLTVATHYSDADESAPAVLAIVGGGAAGTWGPEIAARIPDGCEVAIRTDLDEPGERYAHAIGVTLAERCTLTRRKGAA